MNENSGTSLIPFRSETIKLNEIGAIAPNWIILIVRIIFSLPLASE